MTTRLVGAALAALALLPATAQAAALAPLKPCYVSVTQTSPGAAPQITRESLDLAGNGFTPGVARRRRASTARSTARSRPTPPATSRPRSCSRPTRRKGQGTFTLTAAERGNPANTVALPSRTTALTLKLKPKRARPSTRIRFKGARLHGAEGACGRTTSTRARSARPSGWSSGSTTRAGRSRSSASRSRSSARSWASWRLQVDQQKRKYSRAPDGVNVRADINVQQVFR